VQLARGIARFADISAFMPVADTLAETGAFIAAAAAARGTRVELVIGTTRRMHAFSPSRHGLTDRPRSARLRGAGAMRRRSAVSLATPGWR